MAGSIPGPMGAVLTPSLIGVDKAGHLPNASTFCGRCESVCPVRIPLPKLMRHWREREFERHLTPATVRSGLAFWGFFARRPALYRLATRVGDARRSACSGARSGRFTLAAARRRLDEASRLPGAAGRDLPEPLGWRQKRRERSDERAATTSSATSAARSASPARSATPRRRGRRAPRARAARASIPARGQVAGAERLALFRAQAEMAQATVAEVADAADVPHAVADYLRDHNLPAAIRMGDDLRLAAMPWQRHGARRRRTGRATATISIAVSHAFGAVAETGTLVMVSGPDNPSTLNFLPDNHIVVVVGEGHRRRL